MANLSGLNIDPNVSESGEFTVLPEGFYTVAIASDELKTTKSGTGKLLIINLQVMEGEYKGEIVIDRLNIINQNSTAQAIGQGTLKKICNILSVPFPPKDTRHLWGKPLRVKVVVEDFESNTTGNTLQSNKVKSYSRAVYPNPATEAPAVENNNTQAFAQPWSKPEQSDVVKSDDDIPF